MAGPFTRGLDELRRGDAAAFGGKSASLGELIAAGVDVLGGFAVSGLGDLRRVAHDDPRCGVTAWMDR